MTPHARTVASGQAGQADRDGLRQVLYERVCESYHGVEDFRMKLLGLLPVATGTGVFLLLSGKADLVGNDKEHMSDALLAIGIFGLLFTCGLFAYELFGIKKCHYLIVAGQRLETATQVPGQFRSRPRDLAGFINEPFASAIIYPASMAAWVFLALALKWSGLAAGVVAVAVFFAGYKATRYGARRIKENQEREDRILKLVLKVEEMGEKITLGGMRKELGEEHDCVEPTVPWLDKARAALGREPDWVKRTVHRLREQGELEEERKGQEGQEQAGPLRLAKDAAFRVTSGQSAEEDREGRREAAGRAAG